MCARMHARAHVCLNAFGLFEMGRQLLLLLLLLLLLSTNDEEAHDFLSMLNLSGAWKLNQAPRRKKNSNTVFYRSCGWVNVNAELNVHCAKNPELLKIIPLKRGARQIEGPHIRAAKKNTNRGNEVLPQGTTRLIQKPRYQRVSLCQDPAGNRTTRRPPDLRKETQTAVVWSCLPFMKSGQIHLARHSEREKKTMQTEKGGKTTSRN